MGVANRQAQFIHTRNTAYLLSGLSYYSANFDKKKNNKNNNNLQFSTRQFCTLAISFVHSWDPATFANAQE